MKAKIDEQRLQVIKEKAVLEEYRSILAEKQDAASDVSERLTEISMLKNNLLNQLHEKETTTKKLNDECSSILRMYELVVNIPSLDQSSHDDNLTTKFMTPDKQIEMNTLKVRRDELNSEINALHMQYLSLRADNDTSENELIASTNAAAGLTNKCQELVAALNLRLQSLQAERDRAADVLLNCNKMLLSSQNRIAQRV